MKNKKILIIILVFFAVCALGTAMIGIGKNRLLKFDSDLKDVRLSYFNVDWDKNTSTSAVSWGTNRSKNKYLGAKVLIKYKDSSGKTLYSGYDQSTTFNNDFGYGAYSEWVDKKVAKKLVSQYGNINAEVELIGIAHDSFYNNFVSLLGYFFFYPLVAVAVIALLGFKIFIPNFEWKSGGGAGSYSKEDDPVKDADYYRRRKAADDFVFNSAVARNPSNPNKEYSEHLRDYSFAEMHGASGNQSAEYASLKEAARMASSKGDSFSANELSTKADRVFADIVSKNTK